MDCMIDLMGEFQQIIGMQMEIHVHYEPEFIWVFKDKLIDHTYWWWFAFVTFAIALC
jgi:hypothetical protein